MADNNADVSNAQQLSVVSTFVGKCSGIHEKFLGFMRLKKCLCSEAILEEMLSFLANRGLDLDFCHGQGYDGAGSMAGKVHGAAVRMQQRYPKAICVHCGAHLLSVAIASFCSIQNIGNIMDHMKAVTNFSNSHPKHGDLLCNMIKEKVPSAHHSRLVFVELTGLHDLMPLMFL